MKDDTLWSAWCPLCHRTVVEGSSQGFVEQVWSEHFDATHVPVGVFR